MPNAPRRAQYARVWLEGQTRPLLIEVISETEHFLFGWLTTLDRDRTPQRGDVQHLIDKTAIARTVPLREKPDLWDAGACPMNVAVLIPECARCGARIPNDGRYYCADCEQDISDERYVPTHTHECRDCGHDIHCTGHTGALAGAFGCERWGGGNDGCQCLTQACQAKHA